MKRRRSGILVAVAVGILVQACVDVSSTPEPTAATDPVESTVPTQTTRPVSSTTSTRSTPTTQTPTTTTPEPPAAEPIDWVLEPATDTTTDTWRLLFTIGYGADDELLGTAPGGEGLMLGPDYGAQGPDGTWWFLDGAKNRVAHFDGDGTYLDPVPIGPDLLVDGQYFQFQLPHVLADGTLLASRFTETSTDILTVDDAGAQVTTMDMTLLPRTDDGVHLYGFGVDGSLWNLNPTSGESTRVDAFTGQTGIDYTVGIVNGEVVVDLPVSGIERRIPVTSTIGPGLVHAGLELATGANGTIHVFLLGISESDESIQLAGYGTIDPDGTVSELEPMINPFTAADPGSPAHLGTAYGSEDPWFMVVGEEGVDVYVRS
jgi:hypothetical protein